MSLRTDYLDRVKHVYAEHPHVDAALEYAQSIEETPERITVATTDEQTVLTVYTAQAVYHFSQFRADYIGHASRALVRCLEHFKLRLPIEYVVAHQTFDVYWEGGKIVIQDDREYLLGSRSGTYELVEPVEWQMSAQVLDTVYTLADAYDLSPVELVESAMGTLVTLLDLARAHDVSPEVLLATLEDLVTGGLPAHAAVSFEAEDTLADPGAPLG